MLKNFFRFLRFLLFVLLIILVGFFFFRKKYSPTIRDLARIQVMNQTSDLINDAVDEQIKAGSIQYDRIVYFEKDLDGRITALKTNIGEVNRLKTETLTLINEKILALDTADISIPIGSLILPELFSGRGFGIPVEVIAVRNSDASFSSHFQEAGINQTLQQLVMDVQVDVTVLALGQTSTFPVNSQVVVAETIIVGQVPNTFLQTGGNYGTGTENRATGKNTQ